MIRDVGSIISVVGVLTGAMLLGFNACHRSGLTVETLDKAIKTQVPVGSSKEDVLSFLDSYTFGTYRFKRGQIIDDPDSLSMLREYDNFDDKPKKLGETIGGFVGASIYGVETDPLTHTSLVVRFYFDKNGRMIDYTIKKQVSE